MKVSWEFIHKGWNGLWDIGILIKKKNKQYSYIYHLKTEDDINKVKWLIRKKLFGPAIAFLNKNKVVEASI